MKNDLATAIGTAIAGVIISFLICNMLVGMINTEDFSFKTVDSEVSADIAEPDAEVFNYRALNPTVEVYIGDCDSGDCQNDNASEIDQSVLNEIDNLELDASENQAQRNP